MPMTPRVLYRLKLIGEIHGQVTETAFHFRTKDSSTFTTPTSEASAIVNDFLLTVLPKIQTWASDDWHVKTIVTTSLNTNPSIFLETRLAAGEGFQGGDALPSFCAGLLSLRTGLGGRNAHGRLYLPGVPEDLSIESRLEGVSLAQLSDIGAALVNRYGTSGNFGSAQFGVYSRVLGVTRQAGPPPKLLYGLGGFFTVQSIIARPEIATCRKRKLARGQ